MIRAEALVCYEKDLAEDRASILEIDELVVLCLKIPGGLLRAFDRNHPEPQPPIKEVRTIGGGTSMEEDPTDPTFRVQTDAFESKRAEDFCELALDFIRVLDKNEAEQKARDSKMVRYGLACSDLDRVDCYFLDAPNDEIMAERMKKASEELMRVSTATAKEVRKQEEAFRPEVDGVVGDEAGDAEEPPDGGTEQEDVSVS